MALKLSLGSGGIPVGKWVTHGFLGLVALAIVFAAIMLIVSSILGRDVGRIQGDGIETKTDQDAVEEITETGDKLLEGKKVTSTPPGLPGGSTEEDPEAAAKAERRLAEIRQRQEEKQRRLEELEFQAQHAPLGQGLYGLTPAAEIEPEEDVSPPAEALLPSEKNLSLPEPLPSTGSDPDTDELLLAGTVIPATTISAIDSGLPGIVRAQVSAPVRDSATGTRVLIPPGAFLIGTWADNPDVHAQRLHVYWRKLQMPNGESFELDDTPSADLTGIAGVSGARKSRFWRTLGSAFAISLVTNLAAREQVDDNPLEDALKRAAGTTAQTVTERMLERDLNAPPVFRIAAGTRLNVVLEHDLRLPPWTGR